jgi:hypothetical protein
MKKRCKTKRSWPSFKVLFRHLPEGIEENYENFQKAAGLRTEI